MLSKNYTKQPAPRDAIDACVEYLFFPQHSHNAANRRKYTEEDEFSK